MPRHSAVITRPGVRLPLPKLHLPLPQLAAVLLSITLLLAGHAGWQHLWPVQAGSGWQYRVRIDHLPRISALALDAEGRLFASQEYDQGQGRIVELLPSGAVVPRVTGLSKPDGMLAYRGGLVYSQEQGQHRVNWWHDGKPETLFEGNSIEELATDGYYLYAIEDMHGDGRLLRYDPLSHALSILRTGLNQAEAVAACPDGSLFYSEKASGTLKRYNPDGRDQILLRGLNKPGFLQCGEDGLWLSEDATHMARLLRIDPLSGASETVLSHLRSGQTLLPLDADHFLLAEQGRDRLLEISRQVESR
nr:hypothetical protein [uncultured Pseudomonas sp.]